MGLDPSLMKQQKPEEAERNDLVTVAASEGVDDSDEGDKNIFDIFENV